MSSFYRLISSLLNWLPFLVFFTLLSLMFLADFEKVDKYLVEVVLRSVLIIVTATLICQTCSLLLLFIFKICGSANIFHSAHEVFSYLSTFPFISLGIFSVAIFFRPLQFNEWVILCAFLLSTPTLFYWLRQFVGPLGQLSQFAKHHKITKYRMTGALMPFFITSFVDYFFLALKRALLPLVFVLVVTDYRIVLPRLVEVGMSYTAFVLFISLFVSIHILTYKEDYL